VIEVLLEGIEFVEDKKETMRDFHAGRTDEVAYALFRFNETAADQLVHGQQHGTAGEPRLDAPGVDGRNLVSEFVFPIQDTLFNLVHYAFVEFLPVHDRFNYCSLKIA
jgi:hypothetical protein